VELLVVLGIIGILSGIAFGVMGNVKQSARKAEEISAARNLTAAYLTAATDNRGRLMPGYDRTVGEIELSDGSTVSGPPASRYPFRLMPYVGEKIDGTFVLDVNRPHVDLSDDYSVSLRPALGMNYLYIGGDRASSGAITNEAECLTRLVGGDALLVFASAASGESGEIARGFNILTPPRVYGPLWSNAEWSRDAAPGQYGNVDFRYGGKAVCAFLDGSVRMHDAEELNDMRLWSKNAAVLDDPDYTVQRNDSGRNRRR